MEMPRLRGVFERLGYTDVSTYINSGNVLFSSAETDGGAIRAVCEDAVALEFGFEASVFVISAAELADAVENAPDWWGNDAGSKHNAIFVLPPASPEDIYSEIGGLKPDYEHAEHCGRVIFWSAPLETFSRTRLSRIVGTKAYASVTIRNENTARKLAELAGGKII